VLVIHKIDSLPSRHIVFSAVGSTALFTASYPGEEVVSEVRAFDLGQPVLDFVVAEDGLVWVSLDGNWSEGTLEKSDKVFLRILELSSGELVNATRDSPLVKTLNSDAGHLYPGM